MLSNLDNWRGQGTSETFEFQINFLLPYETIQTRHRSRHGQLNNWQSPIQWYPVSECGSKVASRGSQIHRCAKIRSMPKRKPNFRMASYLIQYKSHSSNFYHEQHVQPKWKNLFHFKKPFSIARAHIGAALMVTQELFYPCALTCVRLFEPFKLVQKYCGEDSLPFLRLTRIHSAKILTNFSQISTGVAYSCRKRDRRNHQCYI